MLCDLLKMTDCLIGCGMAGVKLRRNNSCLAAHLLKGLDIIDHAGRTCVHAASQHGNAPGNLVQCDLDGAIALRLGQAKALAVRTAHKDAVQPLVDAVVDQLAQGLFIYMLMLINGSRNRGNNAINFLFHCQ